jgi:hypothetical protein
VKSAGKREMALGLFFILILLGQIWFFEIPILNYFLTVLSIVGSAYLTYTVGIFWAGFIIAILFGGIFLQGKWEMGLVFVFKVGGSGMILGQLSKMRKKANQVIFFSFLPALLVLALFLLNFSQISSSMKNEFNQTVNKFAQNLSEVKSGVELTQFKEEISHYGEILLKVLPGLQLISLLFDVFLAYLILRLLGAKKGWEIEKVKPFYLWRFWEWLALILGVGLVLNLMGEKISVLIGLNLIVLSSFWYIIQGLATIEFFFKKAHMAVFLKVVFYLTLALTGFISLGLLAIFGFLDSWFDFRKIKKLKAFL